MESETKQAAPWPLDAVEGARMILEVFQSITPYLFTKGEPSVSNDEVLDESEKIVKNALSRSRKNCKAGPMGQFFEQQGAGKSSPITREVKP